MGSETEQKGFLMQKASSETKFSYLAMMSPPAFQSWPWCCGCQMLCEDYLFLSLVILISGYHSKAFLGKLTWAFRAKV